MSDRVVTELVIDSDTSGADRYSQAMGQASAASEQGISSAQGAVLAIAGVSAAFVATLVSARAFYDFVGGQSQVLVDLADHAALAGMNVKEFQQNMFAGMSSGLKEKEFLAGIDQIAADLTAAGRGATDFGKLFEANGKSIRDANGEIKTTKVIIGELAGLMQNASPQVQQGIAKIAGLSKEWIPFLRQGVEGIEAQKKAAEDLGIIIDDATIAKAREFNTQWKTAIATWDLQFKASLAQILPLLVQAANLASTVISGIGAVSGTVGRWMTPDEDKSPTQIKDQIADAERLTEIMTRLGEQSFRAKNLKGALGLPEDADSKAIDHYIDQLEDVYEEKQRIARVEISGGSTVLPKKGDEGTDALENEIQRIEKHIALLKADTEAVGQSEAARAGLRAEASLYAAAEKAGFKDLEQFAEKFMKIREEVEAATAALAKAKVAADIKFGQDTLGLSAESVDIAGRLRNVYPDVATALNSVEAAQMRVLNSQKLLSDGFQDVGRSMLSAFLSGKNVMDAMVQSLDNVAKKLADKAFDNILEGALSGNLVQAGIGVAQAGASALISMFTGDQKAKKELDEAKQKWADMAREVTAFNLAAAGVDLGPLTNELNSLFDKATELARAAQKAEDPSGMARAANSFNQAVVRIVEEFTTGAEKLTPLQQAIKELNDEATGLMATLNDLSPGWGGQVAEIQAALTDRMAQLLADYRDGLVTGLQQRLNDAQGKSYLNDAAALIKQRQQDLSDAALLGNDPALLTQMAAVFAAQAQKIVNDAGLVGDEFADFTALFPDFAGVVTESADALAEANEKFAAMTKTINDYLDSLQVGDSSILSPQDQLAAAQSQFSRQLGLAAGGDSDAMGSITQYASALLDQARAFYASSAGYTDIYQQVTAALSGLTGGSQSAVTSGGSATTAMPTGSGSLSGIVPQVSAPSAASNDNAALFTNQTQALVQAIASVGNAEIQTLKEEMAAIRSQNERLIKAVQDNGRTRAVRPTEKAAG